MTNEALFCVENLRVAYPKRSSEATQWAVDDVSFTWKRGKEWVWWGSLAAVSQRWEGQRCAYYRHQHKLRDR